MTTEVLSEPGAAAPPRMPRPAVRAAALAGLVMLVAEILRVFAGANFATVAPGRCYRSGQPTAEQLWSLVHTHGIRSVINLRGDNSDAAWYDDEVAAAAKIGVRFVNAGLWTYSEPEDPVIRTLVR
jgi:hypothetical protein